MRPRVIGALAVADFADRARRPAFVVLLLAAAGLGYLAAPPAATGYTMVKIGAFRGVYDSGYLGVVLAMVGSLWLSLCGFYAIKNALARDTATGVGQILAATPLRPVGYLLGKFLSNLLVLSAMAGVLAATGLGMLLLRGESDGVDLVALWLPFPLLCLPFLAVTAALAVVFEAVPLLRGGLGNVVWFFGYLVAFLGGLGTTGLSAIGAGMQADLVAQHPGVATEISIGLTTEDDGLGRFHWSGLDVTAELVVQQLGLLLVAALVALLPAVWSTRSDRGASSAPATPADVPATPAGTAFGAAARPRTPVTLGRPLTGTWAGELRVLLGGLPRWWWLCLLAANTVALALPGVLLVTWIWPVLLWSRLGGHAHEHDVHLLVATGAAPRRRLLAEWLAGATVTALAGAGPLLRMLVDGDVPGAAAWLGGVAFIPALALLLGSLARSARLFQLGYLILWYAVVNGMAAVDVMGVVRDQAGRPAGPNPLLVLAATAALLTLTVLTREIRHARR